MVARATERTEHRNPKHDQVRKCLADLQQALENDMETHRKKHSARKCHVGKLPVELLTVIFEEAVAIVHDESRPQDIPGTTTGRMDAAVAVRLSHVCSHWRRAALTSRSLWQNLVLGRKSPLKKVKTWLERSGGRIEELVITPTDADLQMRGSLADAILELGKLTSNTPPARLWITQAAQSEVVFQLLNNAFPQGSYQELNIRGHWGWAYCRQRLQGPNLRSLVLEDMMVTPLELPFNQLRFLKVGRCFSRGVPHIELWSGLNGSPVELLSIGQPHQTILLALQAVMPFHVTLPNLRSLHLASEGLPSDVHTLSAPDLQSFHLQNVHAACGTLLRLSLSSTTSTTQRPRLKILQLRGCSFNEEKIMDALEALGGELEELGIVQAGMDLHPVVDALAGTSTKRGKLCPKVVRFDFSRSLGLSGSPVKALVKSRPSIEEGPADDGRPPIQSLVLDHCAKIEPQLLPWLRIRVARVSCVYENKKTSRDEVKAYNR